MKKLLLLFLMSLTFGVGQIFAQDVFFSEYVEGSGNNKAIEIYNGTGAAIDMSDYTIEKHNSAGAAVTASFTPSAIIVAAGDVYVLANSSAVGITSDETTNSSVMTYNGDDALVLIKGVVTLDIIGTIDGNDPGSEWGAGLISTQNNTIRRLNTISTGDVDGFQGAGTTTPGDISSEWEGFAQNEFSGLGTHAVAATGVPQLLITEIIITPTSDEFIEIYNPTGAVVDLTDVYLTDATHAGSSTYYYNVVTGAGAGGGGFSDFHARFPNGASIAAGEYQTVSLNGSDGFFASFGVNPTYELYEDAGAPDAIPDMLEAIGGSINNQGGLTNSGEAAILYHWDGSSDTVTDLDYALWGDTNEAVDKTGISTDGPDADAVATAYLNDTPIANQEIIDAAAHAGGKSYQRKDLTEGTETKTGGNGAGGHDETSENLAITWGVDNNPTPNAAYVAPVVISSAPSELLLSEVVLAPAEEEYIEIYNPTTGTIVLTDVYLTDATHAGSGNYYYNVVTGANAGGGGFTDFHARFPNGATIAPGEYQTVALNGAADFVTAYGQDPTYELYAPVANAIPDMVEALAGSINYPANEGGLADGGEIVSMYYWDGATDLVTDLDYIMWGDDSEAVDKTGISVDGPDADAVASAYLNDTATGTQDIISNAVHAVGKSFQRIDDTEGTETFVGGNGAGGHNETSENLSVTWFGGASPTPNGPYVPFLINEVDATVAAPENTEFIEIFDRGVGGNQSLNGYIVVLFDGTNDLSYQTYDLNGLTTDANGYFLIGGANVAGIDARVTANTGLKVASVDWLQSGADAVTIYRDVVATFPNGTATTPQNLMDALVYDTDDANDAGLLVLLNAGQAQINENQNADAENHSMQRIANGTGGPLNTSTYKMSAPTDGAVNFAVLPPSAAPTKLLLSEIVLTPTASEYIEIFNPTTGAIDLSDVYLTDATYTPNGIFYSNLPKGSDAGGGGFGDFNARFPNGSTIAAGEYQTIALNGANDFFAAFGQDATYELYENGGANPVPDMLEATAGSINGQGGLSSGEVAVLYYWDGATDLVSDLDYAVWGDKNEAVDKTGETVDGPDAGTAGSTYLGDTDVASQAVISTNSHANGKSYQRIDNSEGTETLVGGNGVQGHDETSENLAVTWFDGGNPTPNAGFIPFVINEVDADTPGSDTAEFVEIFDGGIGNFSLDGYSIVLFNGSDDQSYNNAFDLDGFSTDANGYFVIGGAAVPNVDMVVANNFLQNGADAVALYKDDAANFPNDTPITMTNLIDAFIYDTNDADDAGLAVLITSGTQLNEDGNGNKDLHSAQRIPNGSGGLRSTNAYTLIVPTPGEMNFSITTIAAARAMADGTLGVTIEGNLTSADELGSTAYIQDPTGGIALYNGGGFNWGAYAIGDKLRISGDRASFNDQKQMTNLTIVNLNTSTILVPLVIDLTQMDAHRGELVQIDGLHFPAPGDPLWGNSNFTLTSGADNGIMRVVSAVTDLTNKAQPAICDVIGIMGNYQNTSQLLPRMGADLPCANALTITSSSFSNQTLDVVTWNIEHFGAAGLGPVDDNLQVTKARDVILALDADIYALQEISNDALFISDLLPQLPGYALEVSPFTSNGSTQSLAFLYKTSVITKISAAGLMTNAVGSGDVNNGNYPTGNAGQLWASGRFPYLMTADVSINGSEERINFIVVHGKAFDDNINFLRRKFDAETLRDSLNMYMPNEKIILIGDHNDDMDVSISLPEPSPYDGLFVDQANRYQSITKALSLAGKRSTVSYDNMIDHIGMTNELFSAFMPNSENVHYEFYASDPTYDATTTDHHPVSARFAFPEISINTGTAIVIANNGNIDIGSTPQGTDITQTITINNDGLSDLVIASLTIAGTDLTISAGIAPNTTILAGQTATFDVTMDATTVGIKSATIVITNNDGNEGTYTINITGEVEAPAVSGTGVLLPTVDYTIIPPTELIGTPISTTVINLDWTDNATNENGYYVYQNSIIIAIIPPDSEFFAVTGLTANTFYNFRVEAFNGVTIARSNLANVATLPLDATVGQSTGVCGTSGVAYIQLTGAPQRGSYRWYADSIGGTPIAEITNGGYFETPVLTQTTTFYATAVSSHGLESNPRMAVQAYVYEDVEADLVEGNVVKSCDVETTLHAVEQVGAIYQWRINGALAFEEGIEFVAKTSGRYQLIVTRNSCVDTYGFDVSVNYKPTAIINDAQTTASFCQSGTLLAAKTDENSSNATYEWLLNGNVVGNGTSTTVSQSGTYILRVTDATCVNEAKIGITVFDLPQNQAITASATDFCMGDEVTLTVPSMTGVNYRWFKNGVVIGGANSNTYIASLEAGYSVEMFIDNLNCSVVSQSVAISNFVSPEVELTRDDKTLNLAISISHQTVEWFTTGGEALPQFANLTSISPDFGEYWAVITYPTGCSINSNSIRFFEENPNNGGVISGIDDDKEEGTTFEVFPNPSNDGIFHIRLGNQLGVDAQLKLTDALGRDLNINISIPQGAETLDLDLSEFANGMYYLQFISNEGVISKKIIKQ